jgi:hypothetical protein
MLESKFSLAYIARVSFSKDGMAVTRDNLKYEDRYD